MKYSDLPSDVYWSFLNEVTHLQADGLNFQQAKFISQIIPEDQRSGWLVWYEGLAEWITLEECTGFEPNRSQGRRAPPLPPKRGPSEPEEVENSEVRQQMIVDNRLNRRFVKNYAVEVIGKAATFRSTTINISLGGMRLQDTLPAIVGTNFKVVLRRKDGSELVLYCGLVRPPKGPDGSDGGSDRLRIFGAEKEGVLRQWLISSEIE